MANFRMEGQGIMTGVFRIVWRIEPATPPQPQRNCSTCGGRRLFRSSGKIRLNASGRRLDAWLIYKCATCDRTWNMPLVERAPVSSIPEGDLQAMHQSDPAWVRAREFDLAALGRWCDRIKVSPGLTVTKIAEGGWREGWQVIELAIHAPLATGQRLDRLLAGELRLARSELLAMQQTGGLQLGPASGRVLRKPVKGSVTLRFVAARLGERQRGAVVRGVLDGGEERRF